MSVNGIGAAGYPAWQGARKAENNAKGDFGANVKARKYIFCLMHCYFAFAFYDVSY